MIMEITKDVVKPAETKKKKIRFVNLLKNPNTLD